MINIFGMDVEQIQAQFAEFKLPKFRSKQVAEWMYQKHAVSFGEMTNLGKVLREQLSKHFYIERARAWDYITSKDGKTTKFLLEFGNEIQVETVLMRQSYGNSVCVSSQAGCKMGCSFCASTLNGMVRNLTAAEILAQVMFIQELLNKEGTQVNNIVIMGSGEPMMNYDNVLQFIRLVHKDYILNLGYRNIAISTSGIVSGMKKLAAEGLPITLCVSLHAPDNELRTEIMPVNRSFPVEEVVEAAINYAKLTKRRITYEYILIDGINDNEKQARQLVALLKGQLANVNLIPINPVKERNYQRPGKERVKFFAKYLNDHGIVATIRQEMGTDIQAACGQLRNKHLRKG